MKAKIKLKFQGSIVTTIYTFTIYFANFEVLWVYDKIVHKIQ
jgi:hypothetical protein